MFKRQVFKCIVLMKIIKDDAERRKKQLKRSGIKRAEERRECGWI